MRMVAEGSTAGGVGGAASMVGSTRSMTSAGVERLYGAGVGVAWLEAPLCPAAGVLGEGLVLSG
jgi:hypothetical protein